MMIPSQAIALVWHLRAHGRPTKEILSMLQKPLTPVPYSHPVESWFHRWRDAQREMTA